MKIAVVAHLKYPIAEPFAGGLEAHTFAMVTRLQHAGHDVVLFAAAGSLERGLRAVCEPTGHLAPEKADAAEDKAYRSIVQELRSGDYDIVHYNALHCIPLDLANSIPAPLVAALHCPPFPSLVRAANDAPQSVVWVSVSPTLSQLWPHLPREPIVIDNGVDLTRFRFEPDPEGPRFALWCGRILPEKGLHLAIDAARGAGLPLKICGPVTDDDYWRKTIEPLLRDDIVYLGHLSHEVIASLLAQAAVLVCSPCWDEPFGLVVVEALACGTPVAGFARGALNDILDETCGALAEPDDVAALSSAIHAALSLQRLDCRLRAELFSVDHMIERYEALYRSLVCTDDEGVCIDRLLDDVDAR